MKAEYDEAQAEIGKALAINKALQRKKETAANYRALAYKSESARKILGNVFTYITLD